MKTKKKHAFSYVTSKNILDLFITLGSIVIASAISALLIKLTGISSIVTALFTLAVLCTARMTDGFGWGILASVLGVFAVNFVFTHPFYKLNFGLTGYPIIFISLLLISVITSASTASIKKQATLAQEKEQLLQDLYDFSQQLANTREKELKIKLTLEHLNRLLNRPIIYMENAEALSENRELVCGDIKNFISNSIEQTAAVECFAEKCETGYGTVHSPYAAFRYFPLITEGNMIACIGVLWTDMKVNDNRMDHITMILAQTATSLKRQSLEEERNRAAMEAERAKLRSNLLRSLSHDLRTPLTGIIGASAAIVDNGNLLQPQEIKKLATDINEDAEWLLRMVENLLSVTRITQDPDLKKTEEAAEEIITEAVSRCKKRFPDAQINVLLPDEMLFVPVDVTLIVQVLINLIENAIRHANTQIDISLCRENNNAKFIVRDYGPGISEEQRQTLFHSAQQMDDKRRGGLGIGLTLCYSIITAHNGTILEENHPDGGSQFIFTLPLEEQS